MAFVYRHIRLDKNEPFYIGISKDQYRPYSTKNRSKYWARIVNKSDYRVEILFDDLTYEQAKEKEIEFISLYGRKDLNNGCLVNMTDGGEGSLNVVVSEETRRLISQNNKGRKGFPHSEQSKMKISIAKTGVKQTKEAIENRLAARLKLKYKHSDEVKKKISDTKQKNNNPLNKIVLNLSTGIFYNSAQEASDLISIPLITVYRLCKGQAKSMSNNLKYV
tara:strand:- start:275 stop:934 length:660 start_codon:yes stop_codon:yes gene_type:complete